MKDSEIDREIAFWEKQAGAKDTDLSGKAIDEVRSLIKIKEKNKKTEINSLLFYGYL